MLQKYAIVQGFLVTDEVLFSRETLAAHHTIESFQFQVYVVNVAFQVVFSLVGSDLRREIAVGTGSFFRSVEPLKILGRRRGELTMRREYFLRNLLVFSIF